MGVGERRKISKINICIAHGNRQQCGEGLGRRGQCLGEGKKGWGGGTSVIVSTLKKNMKKKVKKRSTGK